ncbi:MAG: porin [Cyclobacteriaceae bacterium]
MKNFTNLIKTSVVALALLVAGTATAQELTISGSVDAYYRANLNAPNTGIDTDADGEVDTYVAPGTSFANQPGFALGMANIILGVEGEKSGFVADLVFGPRGTDAVFASTTASSSIVNQLYAYWNVSESVTLTMGNFNTFLGYEVISPTANYNYSTSYMFSYGPFSHSGVKADIAIGDASLMLGILNPTDFTDFNPDGQYLLGAQLGVAGQYLNVLAGDDYFQIDFTGGFDLSDATFLGINATYNNDLFLGAALYLQQSLSDDFSLGIRGEYFQDSGLGLFTKDESIIDLTLSANYSVGALTIIPEFRVDLASEDVFLESTNDFTQVGGTLASFVLGAVYSF